MRNRLALWLFIALTAASSTAAHADPPNGPKPHKFGPHTLFGRISSISSTPSATTLVLQKRNGKLIVTDITGAVISGEIGVMYVGRPVALHGDYDAKHVYTVDSITSANGIFFGSNPPDQ